MQLRFSIRDLLLVTAIAALAAGWWIDHQRISNLTVQQWEYKRQFNPTDATRNSLGVAGWEAVGISEWGNPSSGGGGQAVRDVTLLFKRPKR